MTIKVLVTGANGQLAKTLQDLYQTNADEIAFTFLSKKELDISNSDDVTTVFNLDRFNYCINCAAFTNVEQAEKSPEHAFLVNAIGAKNIALACNRSNTTLIHISTDYVFDGEKQTPYTVFDIPNPINEYGKSKRIGEQYIQELAQAYFIIRTSWLYSKEFGNNFYKTILKKGKAGEDITVTNDQKGCPTNTVNLASYIYDLIKNNETSYGIKHYCDGHEMTWFEFAKSILENNHLIDKINLVKGGNYRTFAKRPKNSVLCISK